MNARIVLIPTQSIVDEDSFHDVFAEVLGFPGYYGRNMNAWIDCMGYVDDPDAGMVETPIPSGELLVLQLNDVSDFAQRCPEEYRALLECTAVVNRRRVSVGEPPVLSILISD